MALIHSLEPLDRQIMILYLEDVDAAETSDIIGLSPGAIATRIHRLKTLLAQRFNAGGAQ
jgi:RNA polymerase sigma-70 factor (ECF subfamily)